MPKIKTRKSALKRFKKTVTGKFMRRKAFKGHLLEKKHQSARKTYLEKW
jgi:large subunit ribosomal protein L35